MRSTSWCLLSLLLAAAPTRATPECPRGDAPALGGDLVVERVETHIHVVGGAAALRTAITFRNPGDGPGRAAVTLSTSLGDDRPPPLIAQRASLVGGGRATLDHRDVARTGFEAFVDGLENGVDPDEARDGGREALLVSEHDDGDLRVEVAAACSRRVLTAIVTGALLAEPIDGGERYVVPVVGDRDVLVATTSHGQLWVDGRRPGPGGRVARTPAGDAGPDDDGFDGVTPGPFVVQVHDADAGLRFTGQLVDVAPTPAKAPTDDVKVSDDEDAAPVSPLGEAGFGLLGASLTLPRPLSTMPASLKLVFVIDASVSAGAEGVARALRLMQAVLDAAPADAGWALIAMHREARLVVPPWQARDQRFVPRIDVDNGSDVSAALALARRVGSDAEDDTGRIIVLSDLAQRSGADEALARALVADASSPIVHLVQLPEDVGRDEALDHTRVLPGTSPLATAVTNTRGIHVALGPADSDRDDDLALHLLRPTRLDDLRLFVDGRDVSALLEGERGGDPIDGATLVVRPFIAADDDGARTQETLPVFLAEGDGLRLAARLAPGTRRAELRALAWADEVRLPLTPTKMAPAAIGTATNLDLRDVFADASDALAVVARRYGFVSAETSLVTVPTFRPARPEGLGMRGSGGCGCGGCHGVGIGHTTRCGWGTGKTLKAREILDQLARDIARVCRADVDVTIEVADLEILDVQARGAGRRCVAARWWRARLDALTPGDGSFESRITFTLAASSAPDVDTVGIGDGAP